MRMKLIIMNSNEHALSGTKKKTKTLFVSSLNKIVHTRHFPLFVKSKVIDYPHFIRPILDVVVLLMVDCVVFFFSSSLLPIVVAK